MNNETTVVAIPTTKVLATYKNADDDGKRMLKSLCGDELFLNEYEKIKSYEDACKITGDKPIDKKADMPKHLKAYIKLCTIAKALRGSWKPNWANFDEGKYFPWFEINKKPASLCVGGALSGADVGLSCVNSAMFRARSWISVVFSLPKREKSQSISANSLPKFGKTI